MPKPLVRGLWQAAATKAAVQMSALRHLRAYRLKNECTTASDFVGAGGFRLRRIKAFEGLRAAKFHLQGSTAPGARHLLVYAMDIPPVEEPFPRGDPHHFAPRKQPFERAGGRGVVAFVVQRHDHAFVRNVEIDI